MTTKNEIRSEAQAVDTIRKSIVGWNGQTAPSSQDEAYGFLAKTILAYAPLRQALINTNRNSDLPNPIDLLPPTMTIEELGAILRDLPKSEMVKVANYSMPKTDEFGPSFTGRPIGALFSEAIGDRSKASDRKKFAARQFAKFFR